MLDSSDPLIGHTLNGRYQILSKLARGGMATVYLAQDQRLNRTVAVKVMRTDLGEDPEFVAKFDREARSAATLSHPNVVGVFDQGTENGRPYIVMEYVEGRTLRLLVAKESPMPPDRVLDLAEPIVAALAAAHEAGLVHRDIKPENVLISKRGQVKVADFGLARLVASPNMTATGVLVGTASYLPPELVIKARPDARSDIYSTGVMLFEMLTGRKPHTGETNYQIAYEHVNSDIADPSKALAEAGIWVDWHIPDYVDALVRAATRRDPDLRPRDGRELLTWLRECRQALYAGQMSDPDLAAAISAPEDAMATESIPAAEQMESATTMAAAPVQVDRVWEPKANSQRTTQPTPMSPRTPIFPTHLSQDPVHRRRRRGLAMLLGVLLMATVTGMGSWWFLSGRYTTTPALANGNQSAAEAAISTAGLKAEFAQEYSEDVAALLVTRSEPAVGEPIVKGAVVKVWISMGPERYQMPPVIGLSQEDAETAIRKNNLSVGEVTSDWSDDVKVGLVASSSADKGAQLKRDTAIDLVLSKGPKPIDIKNYEGADSATARKELEALGLKVTSSEANDKDVPAGKIISQKPNDGKAKRGDEISIVISKGPNLITVPDVAYKNAKAAKEELEKAGFTVVVKESGSIFSLGLAAATEPKAGQSAPEGSTVTLHVS